MAKPEGDLAYFRSAREALRKLHRAKVSHNDLAKQQNWLRGVDGNAYSDGLPACDSCSSGGRNCFAIAAYEDIRHFLKHKRKYAPDALTASEKRILAKKVCRRGSGWQPERRFTTRSRAACSALSTAKAAARGWYMMRRSIIADFTNESRRCATRRWWHIPDRPH